MLAGKPENSMKQPDGIATVRINSKTGLRTQPGDPEAIFEVFKVEEVPPYGDGTETDASSGRTKSKKDEPIF